VSPWGDAGRPLARSCVPACFQLQPSPIQQVLVLFCFHTSHHFRFLYMLSHFCCRCI
jgi:hypothetical protein